MVLPQKQFRSGDQARMNPRGLETHPGPHLLLGHTEEVAIAATDHKGAAKESCGARSWLMLELTPWWVSPAPPHSIACGLHTQVCSLSPRAHLRTTMHECVTL